jgi:hypothetical protein
LQDPYHLPFIVFSSHLSEELEVLVAGQSKILEVWSGYNDTF